MDFRPLQARLGVPVDGIDGPVTYAALFRAAGCRDTKLSLDMGRQAAIDLPKCEINCALRIAHFLAQASHETLGFLYLKELGGPSYFARYDGRRDLGNTQPGDGARFPGRGIFQVTGRDNYRRLGDKIGVDLIAHPERAADPAIAVTLACLYWQEKKISALADVDDVLGVSAKINGRNRKTGLPNGFDDRKARLANIRKIVGC